MPEGFASNANVLALGGELKSSICRIANGKIWISEVMGDLEQELVYRHFTAQVDAAFSDSSPNLLVIDKHPDYLSSQHGLKLAREHDIPVTAVQHHYAHIAAVMADNGLPRGAKAVLGFALDGLGFGDDGTIWGGEILLADYHGFRRLACFQPVAMIGGGAATHEPWRNTLAHLLPVWEQVNRAFADTDILQLLNTKPVAMLQTMVDKGLNAPLTSSCGRLFDAVAASLGLFREQVSCEAQAAIALEKLAATCFDRVTEPYSYSIDAGDCQQLNWQPMWLEILADLQTGSDPAIIAARFHHTLVYALTELALKLRETHGFDTVALSGGVFQNRLIFTQLAQALQGNGLRVLQHRQVPTHDGGLSLGQAIIALSLFT
ncbi:MAG: hypothetical protein AUJ57_01220 [Zetaproteobacteria bacterium CG1_02_53_45]|nr:MAG: hypothetical protein AUJ57_01220 [Zetaproteobacteria bacterium CG1_02_53_45]